MPGHRKIGKLRDGLGLKNRYEAVGLVICIWSWAAVHAPSGDLSDVSAQDLADAAGWRRPPKKLLEALVASGLVDRDGGAIRLHDWGDHQGMLQDALAKSRANNAARQRAYRERKRAEREALQQQSFLPECNTPRNVTQGVTGNISGNANNAPTSTITDTVTSLSQSVVVPTLPMGDTPVGGDGSERDVLHLVGGAVGQGVLLLTDRQMDNLLERLGVDGFNAYARRLVSWVEKSGANVDHYRMILRWWQEDTHVGGADV